MGSCVCLVHTPCSVVYSCIPSIVCCAWQCVLYLRALFLHVQVQELLHIMKLGQYKARFAEEMISGEILIELGQEDLERDLDVKSKIHRLRLMKIIEGQHSARNILEGQSPYEF